MEMRIGKPQRGSKSKKEMDTKDRKFHFDDQI
jgi:hypothetical protein